MAKNRRTYERKRARGNKIPMTKNKGTKKSNQNLVHYHFFGNNSTSCSLVVSSVLRCFKCHFAFAKLGGCSIELVE